MITKSDWHIVHEELLAEERRRLGDAMPETEELLAYLRGDLSEEKAERVRDLLVCNPEIARALTGPFPEDEAVPGDAAYVSDDELAKRWSSIEEAMRVANGAAIAPPEARVLQFWQRMSAGLAAALVLVCVGIAWQAIRGRNGEPRVVALHERWLQPDEGRRGGSDATQATPAEGDTLLHLAPPNEERTFAEYRLEIAGAAKTIDGLRPSEDGTFSILVPGASLDPGQHQLILYGIDGRKVERLASYTLRVPPRER